MTERRTVAKGLVFVGAATLIGNAAAYLLSIVAARALVPSEFGALGAMLGILIIIATLSMAIQTFTARRVSIAGADRASVEGQSIRYAAIIGALVVIGGFVLAWPLSPVFSIPYLALAMGIASVGFVVFGTGSLGIAQGREEHLRFSYGFLANQFGRALIAIAFVLVWPSITGISLGLLVGCAIGSIISYLIICPRTWGRALAPGGTIEYLHIAHALIVLFTLTNIDVLLARIFLTPDQSGEYSVGVLLAKIAFFLPNAIIIVLFPKMSAANSRRTVLVATGLTAIVGVVVTAISFLLGSLVIRILGGAQYADLAGEAWLFALEGSAFALVQVLLYARLAAQDRRAAISVWVALIVLVVSVVTWRHHSVAEIVTTVVAVSLLLTVVGLVMDARNARQAPPGGRDEEPVVPIEAAE